MNKVAGLLRDLRRKPATSYSLLLDTHSAHQKLFAGLTPSDRGFYAGHYRGEKPEPLLSMRAFVGGEEKALPGIVDDAMSKLRGRIKDHLSILDKQHRDPVTTPEIDFLLNLVAAVASIFCDFLQIHPYVNGNGHIARLMVVAMFGRYGFWITGWSVHPRPPEPKYTDLQDKYWAGKTEPLHTFLMTALLSVKAGALPPP